MRSRLKSVAEINEFSTDLDAKTATIKFEQGFDINSALNELAKLNNKMTDWSRIEN